MDGFAILIAIVTFIMALVALNKISSLETRIAELKLQLGNAIEELAKLLAGEVAPPSGMKRLSLENPWLPSWFSFRLSFPSWSWPVSF